jgi:hypothetical protein
VSTIKYVFRVKRSQGVSLTAAAISPLEDSLDEYEGQILYLKFDRSIEKCFRIHFEDIKYTENMEHLGKYMLVKDSLECLGSVF